MRFLSALFTLIMLAGCAAPHTPLIPPEQQDPPLSGYRTEFAIQIHPVKDRSDAEEKRIEESTKKKFGPDAIVVSPIAMACARHGSFAGPDTSKAGGAHFVVKVEGCSYPLPAIHGDGILLREPSFIQDLQIFEELGHELWHSIGVDFHRPWDELKTPPPEWSSSWTQTPLPNSRYRESFEVHVHLVKESGDVGALCAQEKATFRVPVITDGGDFDTSSVSACSAWDKSKHTLSLWFKTPRYLEDLTRFSEIGYAVWYGVAGDYHPAWQH